MAEYRLDRPISEVSTLEYGISIKSTRLTRLVEPDLSFESKSGEICVDIISSSAKNECTYALTKPRDEHPECFNNDGTPKTIIVTSIESICSGGGGGPNGGYTNTNPDDDGFNPFNPILIGGGGDGNSITSNYGENNSNEEQSPCEVEGIINTIDDGNGNCVTGLTVPLINGSNDLSAYNLFISGLDSDLKLKWNTLSDSQQNQIAAFLEANKVNNLYTDEAKAFAEEVIRVWDDNSDAEVDFEEEIIIDSSVPECVKNIINKIISEDSYVDLGDMPDFVKQELNLSGVIMDIFNNSSQFHLNFKVGDLQPNDQGLERNAKTNFNVTTRAFDITLNSNYVNNATDLAISRTIIHESLHAYIEYIYQTEVFSDLSQSLSYLLSQNNNNPNTAQHILMTQNFVQSIANSLESWDNSSLPDSNYYNYISWSGGMLSTDAFNDLPDNIQENIFNANINEGQANNPSNNNALGDENCN